MFGALFKKKPLDALFAEAHAQRAAGAFGDAKLAFDRIADRAAKESPARALEAERLASVCCDDIARQRIEEARRLIRAGAHGVAREELQHAVETARDITLQEEAQALLASLVSVPTGNAVLDASPSEAGRSDEETLALIMADWSPARAAELESYGEPLFDALLHAARGQLDPAIRGLRSLLMRAPKALYLQLELATLLLAAENKQGAEEALRTVLARIPPEGADDALLGAHRALAQLCHDRGDAAGAERELTNACEALLDDPRPYLDLGHYLRSLGRAPEAVEVLRLCEASFPAGRVDWSVLMELGLALTQAGEREAAHGSLNAAARALEALGAPELPPALSAALAAVQPA